MEKIVRKMPMDDKSEIQQNLEYWLSCPPEERIAEVMRLRNMVHGTSQPIKKVVRIIKLSEK